MDILKLEETAEAQNQGAELKIVNPVDGKPMGLIFTVYGPDSDAQKTARSNARSAITKIQSASITGDVDTTSAEDIAISMIAECVRSWNAEEGGKSINCTPEAVSRILKKFPWIRAQVDEFANSRIPYKKQFEEACVEEA